MANEDEKKIDKTEDLEDDEILEDLDESDDSIDWKAEAQKRGGSAKRYKTQTQKLKDELAQEKAKSAALAKNDSKEKKEFDYAEKAYLKSSGIQKDEFDLVQEVMQSTGKTLDEVLESRHFQADLKDRRDEKASKDAIPSGSKRSNSTSRNDVEYWIAKGELPSSDQRELRQKVVNERIKLEKGKSQFSDHPVVK